jgi:phosphatidylinositol glycan class A protein
MRICMVSDFFYPQLGGVEVHIYELSKELTLRGHKVIVITHRYGNEVGVRWLEPGIKVYYIPFFSFSFNTIIPTFFLTLPLAR